MVPALEPVLVSSSPFQTLDSFAVALLEAHSLDDLLWSLVETVAELLGLEDCVLYLLEGELLVQAAAYGVKNPQDRTIHDPIAIPLGQGIVGTVAARGCGEVVDNTRTDPRYISDQFAGASEMAVPLLFQGAVLGVLDSEAEQPGRYTCDDLALFQALANVAASRVAWLLSERERAREEQDRAARRMAALGKLAGGVAHDFNNLLTVIGLQMALGLDGEATAEDRELARDTCGQAIDRAKGLTRQLMAFGRGGAPLREAVDLAALLRESLGLFRSEAGVQLRHEIAPDLPPVWADPDQLAQVLHNLLLNAVQAMERRGQIRVTAAPTDGADGRQVRVTVEDTGPGIPASLRETLFDPYVTTKAYGTGLGLATSYWILRRHGGMLSAGDSPGGGATFTLQLPAFHSRAVRSSADAEELRLPALRVLVLEDEPLLAAGLRQLLRQEGHEAFVVADGSDVAPLWRQHLDARQPFDVAVLDLVQPTGPGGEAALAALRREDPTAHAVVMSGYADADAVVDHQAHGFQARLDKPFDLPRLRRALHAALVAGGTLPRTHPGAGS